MIYTLRTAPGGSILGVVDGDDIRLSFGGARLLSVDGSDIRPTPGGERILHVDGSDVRCEPGGPRLAYWDDRTLRRTPGGEILLVVDGDDIRPEAGGPRLAYLDGGDPGTEHLTALLHHWRPSLFELSDEELQAAQEAIEEGQAWDDEQADPATEAGSYRAMSGGGAWKANNLEVQWTGTHYEMRTDGGVSMIGHKYSDSGWRVVGAMGKGAYRAGVFHLKNGEYAGVWQPDGTSESWPEDATKAGKLTLVDTNQSLNGQGRIYAVTSDHGGSGFAYTFGVGLGMVIVLGAEVGVFDFQSSGSMLNGDYYAGGSNTGYFMVAK